MAFNANEFLANVSSQPGVYQMLDRQGKIIYVGKARQLKNRLASYFHGSVTGAKTLALVKHIAAIDVTVTENELEALLLEYNLIQQHKPRYNVLFRDDKSYPYLYLSSHQEYPRLEFYRGAGGARKGKGVFFGPYPSVRAVRQTLKLLQRVFKIRSCRDSFFHNRTRPCLQYQIQRCSAPCVKYITPEDYQKSITHVTLFLEGKSRQVIDDLTTQMQQASETLDFEKAAALRDQIIHLREVQTQQYVTKQGSDMDIIAVVSDSTLHCVYVLTVRDGRVLGSRSYFPKAPKDTVAAEVLTAFIQQYYLNQAHQAQIPAQIIVNQGLAETESLSEFLSQQRGSKVRIQSASRGERKRWLKMAENNAASTLQSQQQSQQHLKKRFTALQECFKLAAIPQRIECFDVSHTQGEATVASCVVFTDEGAEKNDYRRFNITDVQAGDDYAAMQQALKRHFTKLKEHEAKIPDILLIDGGKGQLSVATEVLEELQISNVLIIGIAKGAARKPGLETLFLGTSQQEIHLSPDDPALHLLQQIRDEAHRFAISAHRQQRAKKRRASTLEEIPGVGAKRRQALLRHFGGLQQIKKASPNQFAEVPGISQALAQTIYDAVQIFPYHREITK